MRRLKLLFMDLITIPSTILNKKANAIYHLKFICPKCPAFRRKMRDVDGIEDCWWYHQWKKKNYNIPRHFGILNWIKQYALLRTDLTKFKK